jgi:hypothetical protein
VIKVWFITLFKLYFRLMLEIIFLFHNYSKKNDDMTIQTNNQIRHYLFRKKKIKKIQRLNETAMSILWVKNIIYNINFILLISNVKNHTNYPILMILNQTMLIITFLLVIYQKQKRTQTINGGTFNIPK